MDLGKEKKQWRTVPSAPVPGVHSANTGLITALDLMWHFEAAEPIVEDVLNLSARCSCRKKFGNGNGTVRTKEKVKSDTLYPAI